MDVLDEPLIWWRTIHFAATLTAAGVVIFLACVAEPALRTADPASHLAVSVRNRLTWLFWGGLGVAVVSGIAWLIEVAQQMTDGTLTAVLWDGIVWIVLTKTGFGTAWLIRLALAGLLAVAFSAWPLRWRTTRWSATLLAAGLAATLGFTGHAAAGFGSLGMIHLVADMLHLIAAATWAGGLIPLAILLRAAMNARPETVHGIVVTAARRFSTLGIAGVGTLSATGAVNGWMLTGSLRALTATDYGRLLLAKIALFFVMVAVAAVNRLVWTPRLAAHGGFDAGSRPLRWLRNNCVVEAVVAALVIAIVGVLGTLPPALMPPD